MVPLAGAFRRCPQAWLREDAREIAQLVSDGAIFQERGLPPLSGGYLDQPSRWVEICNLIEAEKPRIAKDLQRLSPHGPKSKS